MLAGINYKCIDIKILLIMRLKDRKLQQQYQEGWSWKWKLGILLAIIIGGLWYFERLDNVYEWTKMKISQGFNRTERVNRIEKVKQQPISLDVTKEWCRVQAINTGDSLDTPISNNILGFDILNNCCVQRWVGYNICFNREVTLEICYSSSIGGELIFSRVDGYYLINPLDYKIVLTDLKKTNISGLCSGNVYPEEFK